jgi:hypothetical protein
MGRVLNPPLPAISITYRMFVSFQKEGATGKPLDCPAAIGKPEGARSLSHFSRTGNFFNDLVN